MVGHFVFRIRSLGINLNHGCMNGALGADVTERVCACRLRCIVCVFNESENVRVSHSGKVHQDGSVGNPIRGVEL